MSLARSVEWLRTAEALPLAITAVLAAVGTLVAKMQGLFRPLFLALGLPLWAEPLVVASIVVALAFVLWRSYRKFAESSRLERPEAFTLHPRNPESLIGREEDLSKLLNTVRSYRLVLLDGESGCGKSALVSAGLVPRLRQTDGLLPVLVRDWGDDWVRGPLAAALDALFLSLDEADRVRLGWLKPPDMAAPSSSLVHDLDVRLSEVVDTLERRPLLIADQFDDYQARHRSSFLDADANWIKPIVLADANPFWKLVRDGLGAGRLIAGDCEGI